MMRTVTDLRRAMIEVTDGLASNLTFADIQRGARRRRLRWGFTAVIAGLLPALTGLLVAGAQPADGPRPAPTVARFTADVPVDPSFPPVGGVALTGVQVGPDEQLVLWLYDGPALAAGLRHNTTGNVRLLGAGGGGTGGFKGLAQLDDRFGGTVDYGLFLGDAARITVTVGGQVTDATLAPWSRNRTYVVFWARRTGPRLSPTSEPTPDPAAQPRFTAYDSAGRPTAVSNGQSQRSDGGVNAEDRPQVGELMPTGQPTASGRELVFWFVGDETGAMLKAGERDRATGAVTALRSLGVFARPPFAIGFYRGTQRLDGPAGTAVLVGQYVGAADRVVMVHPAEGVVPGSARWSAHPELVVYWLANVPAGVGTPASAVAYDAHGRVVAAYG